MYLLFPLNFKDSAKNNLFSTVYIYSLILLKIIYFDVSETIFNYLKNTSKFFEPFSLSVVESCLILNAFSIGLSSILQ